MQRRCIPVAPADCIYDDEMPAVNAAAERGKEKYIGIHALKGEEDEMVGGDESILIKITREILRAFRPLIVRFLLPPFLRRNDYATIVPSRRARRNSWHI